VYPQEIILSEEVKQYYKLIEETNELIEKINNNEEGAIQKSLEKYEEIFKMSTKDNSIHFWSYANRLASLGNLQKAVIYFEKAIKHKHKTADDFNSSWVKKYFEKDTSLYNQKLKEFYKIPITYSARELELLSEVKEVYAADQFARIYHDAYPEHNNCSKNTIIFVDSITMVKIVKLIEKYPEYSNPLDVDHWAKVIIGRHIFTAYPEFWLTHFEPKEREQLILGNVRPKSYARTYDRCIITSGKEKYSYYGEWDDDGKAANPDKELVNKRRANLGLPPLEEKKINPYELFITY
jgi:tetratricopeptide (TPR) repeat protein